MRPHHLTFGGIGPYAQETEVDFDLLGAMGLYLIVGPTGSGKTTIFDAMTYALFGSTASSREFMFVSDLSSRIDPFVKFEFSHQGRRFIAHRKPAKEAGKKSKTNDQWLRELDATGAEVRTVTGTEAMRKQVEELLGLDAEQFMKVVLLPQGKFQEFLMASSTKRQPILRKIFGTKIFDSIAENLKAKVKEMEGSAKDTATQLESERGTARNVVETLGEELNSLLPDPDEDLPGVISALQSLSEKHQALVDKATKAFGEAQASLATAVSDAVRFDADFELQKILKIHKSLVDVVEAAISAIGIDEKAKRVIKIDDDRQNLVSTAKERGGLVDDLRSELDRILRTLSINEAAVVPLTSAVIAASPVELLQQVTTLSKRIDLVVEAVAEIEELQSKMQTAEQTKTDALNSIESLEATKTEINADLEIAAKKLEECQSAQQVIPALELKIGKWDELHERGNVERALDELLAAQRALDVTTAALLEAEERLDIARRDRTRHLAGELAETLVDGESCPVCGSLDHPTKAVKTSDVDIDVLERARDEAQRQKSKAEPALKVCQESVEQAKEARVQLPTVDDETNERKRFEALKLAVEDLNKWVESVDRLKEQLGNAHQQIGSVQLTVARLETESDQYQRQILDLQPRVTELGDPMAVAEAVGIISSAEGIVKNLEEIVTEAERAAASVATAKDQVVEALSVESFTSVEEARAAVLSHDDYQRLKLLVEAAEERGRRMIHLKGVIGTTTLPEDRPDIDRLTDLRDSAEGALGQAQDLAVKVSFAVTQLEPVQKNIAILGPKVLESLDEAQRAGDIAKTMVYGSGSGADRRLALEEWVQRALFEEVCEVATRQLLKLSNNRYVLTLDPEDAKARSHAGGLELYVLDSQSGKTRSVQTLSGGEQFLTSLSLALALADVVERHAGGMELSALFIDEGFGSLDADTLEAAMDVLMKLQDTGRTIGVITHVEAMQQQLPVGIRIEKSTTTGSTLRVVANA